MLKILSFNACLLPPLLKNASSTDDLKKERINLFFKKYSYYDIILFQEVWDTCWTCKCNSIQDLIIDLGLNNNFIYNYKVNRKWYQICNNGLLVLSKYEIDDLDYITFQNSSGLQWFVPNGVIYTKIKNIDFFVTHIHAGPLDSSFKNNINICKTVQEGQINELLSFVKSKNVDKYIILGDFNSDALNGVNSQTMISYEKLCSLMNQESLLKKINYPNTYPVPLEGSFLVNNKFANNKSCIDHVFSNVDINHINVKTLKVNKLYLSDHAAIELSINL